MRRSVGVVARRALTVFIMALAALVSVPYVYDIIKREEAEQEKTSEVKRSPVPPRIPALPPKSVWRIIPDWLGPLENPIGDLALLTLVVSTAELIRGIRRDRRDKNSVES